MDWDLVVIDEAHRLRNVYKPANRIANAIKSAVFQAPKLLLTATPLQNSLLELYGLVSIIDDHTFGDIKSYKSQFSKLTNEANFDDLKARLAPICKRTLRRQVLEYIKFTNRIPITQEFTPYQDEQQLYERVSDYLQKPNLYALPQSQRKLMTLILRKLLSSSTYAISATFNGLAQKLEGILEEQENLYNIENNLSEDFETFDELKDEWANLDEDELEEQEIYTEKELEEIKEEINQLKQFRTLAQSIQQNAKGESLLIALKKGFQENVKRGGNKKALIFTESTRTQRYLKQLLENGDYQGKLVLFNGSNNDKESKAIYQNWLVKHKETDRISGSRTSDMRAALVDYFREEAVIMLATESAAEGINLQFCSLVVNYDLPWNPQRIEQRIGRCHRYGQTHDVVVVNFLNKKNAADERVFELLSEKFRLFDGVFGASDEVLGSIESGVDFEKRIAEIYQNCRTPDEIQESFDQLRTELEGEIDEKMTLTRQKLLENFDEEVQEKLKINLHESREYISKYESWLWMLTKFHLTPYAEINSEENAFLLKSNPFPQEHIPMGRYRMGKAVDDAHIYRIGHSLAQSIIKHYKDYELRSDELIIDYSGSQIKISILEPLLGKKGWLSVNQMTIDSFEAEDHLILCGVCEDGTPLDIEQCQRLFSVSALTQSKLNDDL